MAGTKINHSGTVGVDVTLDVQNPVVVTASGTIVTSGTYALLDSAPSPGRIKNYGVLTSTAASGVGV